MPKKKVLLVSPNTETFPMPVYPLALARLARAVEQAGHQARQFDLLAHGLPALPQVLHEFQPNLVALSLRNIDNNDAEACCAYAGDYTGLVRLIRGHTRAPIVLGGSGFSIFPDEFLVRLGADFGVIGPGEAALVQLLKGLAEEGGQGPRLLRGAGPSGAKGGAAISRGRHDPQLVDYYWRRGGMIGLQTKRGCHRHCSYCTYPLIDGGGRQHAEVGELVEEMALLAGTMGVSYFFLVDSLFNQDPEYELALAGEICRRGLKISWGAFFAPAGLTREYLAALKESGLTHMEFGTESFSDQMLASYRKGFTAAEALANGELARELGLYTAHYLLFGGPGETPDTVKETLARAKSLKGCVFFPFAGVRLYPGTELFFQARRENLVKDEGDCFEPLFYTPASFGSEAIWELVRAETQGLGHFVLPSRYGAIAPALRRLRSRGLKGPLWEYLRGG